MNKDTRRYRENSTGIVFQIAWQALSPNSPVWLCSVNDPILFREVMWSDIEKSFTPFRIDEPSDNVCANVTGRCGT